MSIIDPKYRGVKKGKDWLSATVEKACVEPVTKQVEKTAEDGTKSTETVTLKKTSFNLDKLFALAEENKLDVAKYKADVDKPGAPGRLRMTIGNMLRSAARKRHGLNIDGEFVEADKDFIGDSAKTHNPDGSKIKVEKPEDEKVEA